MTAAETYVAQLLTLARRAREVVRVLEIGGGPEGVSGRAFCEAMGKGGELWTIDINPYHPPQAVMERAQAEFGVEWFQLTGDSLEVDLTSMGNRTFDLLYIDGAHDERHALGDFQRYAGRVRGGGLVVFDDFPGTSGVGAAVYELEQHGVTGVAMVYDTHNGNAHYVIHLPNGVRA